MNDGALFTVPAFVDHTRNLKLRSEREFLQKVRRLTPGDYDLAVFTHAPRRSNKANAYLWGVCYRLLSAHTGYTPDELHAHFKKECLGVQTKRIVLQDANGEVRHEGDIAIATTTTLTTQEFYAFVERVRQVGAELGVVIPDPDKEYMFNKKDAAA